MDWREAGGEALGIPRWSFIREVMVGKLKGYPRRWKESWFLLCGVMKSGKGPPNRPHCLHLFTPSHDLLIMAAEWRHLLLSQDCWGGLQEMIYS